MLQIRGKLGNFCCKSGASWENFVANQGQVGKFLLQIRGNLGNFCCKSGASGFFLRGLFLVVHGFQPEGESAAFVDFRFHG